MEHAAVSTIPSTDLDDTASKPPRKPDKSSFRALISGLLFSIGVLLLKLKAVLFFLVAKSKLLVVNPFEGFGIGQLAVAGGSMAVTMVAYAFKMGAVFAVGFVLLTVIHELGHAVVIRAKGLRAGAMVFIPFVGGAVTLKDQPRSAYDDAQIGLAGPIAGTLASFGCLLIFYGTGRLLYLALAYAGFLLNLFNLLPIAPLDGGRIAAAITKWMWVGGGLIVVYFMIAWRNPLLILVLLLGLVQLYRAATGEQGEKFYDVTAGQRGSIALVYFLLICLLGYQSVATHRALVQASTPPLQKTIEN